MATKEESNSASPHELQTLTPNSDSSNSGHLSPAPAQTPAPAPAMLAGVADSSVKPIKSRPMDAISAAPHRRAGPAGSGGSPHPRSKRSKVVSPVSSKGGSAIKKRIWGKNDEIVLLHGLLDYQAKNGVLPTASKEMETLHRLVEPSLGIKVSNMQLSDKVRGLKRKFNRSILRGKDETDPSFSDSHEKTIFLLCKSIWGSNKALMELPNPLISDDDSDKDIHNDFSPINNNFNNNHNDNINRNHFTENGHAEAQNVSKSEKVECPFLTEMVENIAKEEFNGAFLKRALMSLDGSKAMAIEKKIKKLRTDEIELGLRRIELIKESVKLLLDGVKKSE